MLRSFLLLLVGVSLAVFFVSCDQGPSETDSTDHFVTTSPELFAVALRQLENDNEVNIILKPADVPPVAPRTLKEAASGSVVAAVPETEGFRRTGRGFPPSGVEAYNALLEALDARGVQPYRAHPEAETMSLRIPNDKLVSVLEALLTHPNVDYVAANQAREVSPDALRNDA